MRKKPCTGDLVVGVKGVKGGRMSLEERVWRIVSILVAFATMKKRAEFSLAKLAEEALKRAVAEAIAEHKREVVTQLPYGGMVRLFTYRPIKLKCGRLRWNTRLPTKRRNSLRPERYRRDS